MPSIGKDLQKIRVHLGYTIQDIQQSTKIPVSTLKDIENDYIFDRSDEGTTYVRSFVRSYGRALRIDDNVMIKALDQHAIGNYSNLLLQDFPGLLPAAPLSRPESSDQPGEETAPPVETETIAESAEEEDETKKSEGESIVDKEEDDDALTPVNEEVEESEEEIRSEKVITTAPNTGKPDNEKTPVLTTETPADEPSPARSTGEPSVSSVNWANLGNKAATKKKKSSAWIFGIILLVAVIGAAAYVMIDNGFFSSAEVADSEQIVTGPPSSSGGVDLDLGNNGELTEEETTAEQTAPPAATSPGSLDDMLFITVFAAYDVLDPVRVWSDLKPRLDPYWLEQGTALNFEFQDTIRIRGPYANMLIFKNGHRISDFQEYFIEEENYVELTRDYFTSDAKWPNSIPFELPAGVSPPQSVENRPTF